MYDIGEIQRRRRRRALLRLTLIVLLVPALIGVGVYLYASRDKLRTAAVVLPPAPTARARALPTAPPPTAPRPTETRPELPPLDGSDALIRKLAAAISANPAFASWLMTEGLVRRFVVVVDNVAEGKTPQKQVPFLTPKGRFDTIERGGRLVIDRKSYARYDSTAEAIASLEPRGSAELYKRLKPLIQDAYGELGYPGRNFDDTLARAIDQLLKTPIPEGEVGVRQAVKSVKYEKAELESLTAAQKQFLRMGPENMKKVKQKLRDLSEALGLPKNR